MKKEENETNEISFKISKKYKSVIVKFGKRLALEASLFDAANILLASKGLHCIRYSASSF